MVGPSSPSSQVEAGLSFNPPCPKPLSYTGTWETLRTEQCLLVRNLSDSCGHTGVTICSGTQRTEPNKKEHDDLEEKEECPLPPPT